MYDLNKDIESEARKIDEKIKKLQEEKAKLKEKLVAEKQQLDLARKVGILIVNEYKGKHFTYSEFEKLLDKHLVSDFERQFFELPILAVDDERRPKKRGRKKATETS